MSMFYIKMADLSIRIENEYDFVEHFCRDYLCEPTDMPDLSVSVSREELEAERRLSPVGASEGYCEAICLYRQISDRLPAFDAFLFHGAVVELDGVSYIFAARSGVGKSTHVSFWLERFGARARVINGDKPILRFVDGKLVVYGTPWCGKENWQTNAVSPVVAFCFLARSENNFIRRQEPAELLERLIDQVRMPPDPEMLDRFLTLLDRALALTPLYRMGCNLDPEAAEVARAGMCGETL